MVGIVGKLYPVMGRTWDQILILHRYIQYIQVFPPQFEAKRNIRTTVQVLCYIESLKNLHVAEIFHNILASVDVDIYLSEL